MIIQRQQGTPHNKNNAIRLQNVQNDHRHKRKIATQGIQGYQFRVIGKPMRDYIILYNKVGLLSNFLRLPKIIDTKSPEKISVLDHTVCFDASFPEYPANIP